MSNQFRSNRGRWILLFLTLAFLIPGGIEVWAFPKEICPYMAFGRSVAEDQVQCPAYTGEHPVFEMYSFSLGKHLTMIGLVFAYFALRGGSKEAIQLGLVYVPVALWIDWIPPLTWFDSSGVGTSIFPPIFWVAVFSTPLSVLGLWINGRHWEWGDGYRTT